MDDERVDELPVDATSTREGLSTFGALVARVKAQVEANIAEREARGETIAPPPVDHEGEARARLQRLVDRHIPARAALVLASSGGAGEPPPMDLETPAMRIMREFMAGPPGTIGISGGVGCGKTIAAAWAVAQRVRERYLGPHPDGKDGRWPADLHPRFIDASRLSRLPRLAGRGESAAAFGPYETCALLAIDDVGAENDQGFAGILDSLIVTRHEDGLRTILTSNMKLDAIGTAYGNRVLDRLRGSGGFFALDEPSRRGR